MKVTRPFIVATRALVLAMLLAHLTGNATAIAQDGRTALSLDDAKAVWKLQLASVSEDLGIKDEAVVELAKVYFAARESHRALEQKLPTGDNRKRRQANRRLTAESRGKLKDALKDVFEEEQLGKVTTALSPFSVTWDTYVHTVSTFKLENEPQAKAIRLINKHNVEIAAKLAEIRANQDWSSLQPTAQAMKKDLDTALSQILSEEQLSQWKRQERSGDADLSKTLAAINDRFKKVEVQLVEWPAELQEKLGELKRIAFMAFPEKQPAGKLPLLISLHGAGGRNMSLQEQLVRSAEVKGLGLAELAGNNLILLEPNSAGIWNVGTLNAMLDYVLENHPEIDTNRIYVMGHSMGAYGTWVWINESADRFAAASPSGIPIGDSGDVERLVNLPIWGMVGGGDKKDRVAGIKRMVERLRAAGNKQVKYTEFPGADHAAGNAAVFSSVELVDWMLGFSRKK
jgi:predicted peptidase